MNEQQEKEKPLIEGTLKLAQHAINKNSVLLNGLLDIESLLMRERNVQKQDIMDIITRTLTLFKSPS